MQKEVPLPIASELPPFNVFDAKITRRELFKKIPKFAALSTVVLGTVAELKTNTLNTLAKQMKDREVASLDNDSFIDVNKDNLAKIKLGCSFAPEQFGLSLETINEDKKNGKLENALFSLRFAVKHLGIRKVRLGIRWNNSVNKNAELDFRLYKPFLDYCLENNLDIYLNTGIKVLRWPEDHVPDFIIQEGVPPKYSTVFLQSELAKKSLNHTHELFNFLKNDYGDKSMTRITTIQPENEPFDGFGENSWKMDADYLKKIIDISLSYFPNSNILINSSNPLNLNLIHKLFSSVTKDNPKTLGKLISGYDYYPFHPAFSVFPGLGRIDPISASKILNGDKYTKQKEEAGMTGYKIEITEGQAEPWGNIQLPGNSAWAFRFMIQRSINHVLDPTEESVISVWGIEYLAKIALSGKQTAEHVQIFDFVQKINN